MPNNKLPQNTHSYEALMRYAKLLGYGDVHVKRDAETGLHAIIAIHNTHRGPALGGTRCYAYKTAGHALKDVLRLGYMMTLKAAISDLPHGGGKSVIIKPRHFKDRDALFRSFGDFVHEQNGRYITAIDVGTETHDMDIIATRTPYVIGAATVHAGHSDPAAHTALGVFRGIQASVQFKLNRANLNNLHVVIQGAGHVGYALGKLLAEQGCRISIADPNTVAVQRCVTDFGATPIDCETVYDINCDIFSPCALGGILNLATINRLRCSIVAGSANNQLAHRKYAQILNEKNILYAPDFLINSGGLINAALVYDSSDEVRATRHIMQLYDTTLQIYEHAAKQHLPTTHVAEKIALEKIGL